MNAAPGAQRAFLVFAATVAAFQNLPTLAGEQAQDFLDLATPFAVLGAALLVLRALGAGPVPLAIAAFAAILYTDGHGIHLAANSINNRELLTGQAADTTHFWDEEFGHIEWHLGWFGLILAACLAESRRRIESSSSWPIASAVAVLLGFTLFVDTVEGGTWWLELAATAVFAGWAIRERRPVIIASAAAFAAAAALIGIWAIWRGGVPQFSEVGWL